MSMSKDQARKMGCTHVGNFVNYKDTMMDKRLVIVPNGNKLYFYVADVPLPQLKIPTVAMIHLKEEEFYWAVPGTKIKFSKVDGEHFCFCGREHCQPHFHPMYLDLTSIVKI